jgi:hypothetical protein
LGVWISPDPVVTGRVNLYWYVSSNPIRLIDSDGRDARTPAEVARSDGEKRAESDRAATESEKLAESTVRSKEFWQDVVKPQLQSGRVISPPPVDTFAGGVAQKLAEKIPSNVPSAKQILITVGVQANPAVAITVGAANTLWDLVSQSKRTIKTPTAANIGRLAVPVAETALMILPIVAEAKGAAAADAVARAAPDVPIPGQQASSLLGQGRVKLPIVNPHFDPSVSPATAFQGATESVASKLIADAKLIATHLELHQNAFAAKGPWAQRMVFGNAVENALAKSTATTGLLKHTGGIRPYVKGGPDFVGQGPWSGLNFQVTTRLQYMNDHLANSPPGTLFGLYDGPKTMY